MTSHLLKYLYVPKFACKYGSEGFWYQHNWLIIHLLKQTLLYENSVQIYRIPLKCPNYLRIASEYIKQTVQKLEQLLAKTKYFVSDANY